MPNGEMAKASGTIEPRGVLSLTDGSFLTDGPYHRDGSKNVAKNRSTKFFTVLSDKDEPAHKNQARIEFAYRILDDGQDTGMRVAGLSTNYRGVFGHSEDGRCAIYNSNPLAGGGRLDDHTPVGDSNYFCAADGDFVDAVYPETFHSHFKTSFSVVRTKHEPVPR